MIVGSRHKRTKIRAHMVSLRQAYDPTRCFSPPKWVIYIEYNDNQTVWTPLKCVGARSSWFRRCLLFAKGVSQGKLENNRRIVVNKRQRRLCEPKETISSIFVLASNENKRKNNERKARTCQRLTTAETYDFVSLRPKPPFNRDAAKRNLPLWDHHIEYTLPL